MTAAEIVPISGEYETDESSPSPEPSSEPTDLPWNEPDFSPIYSHENNGYFADGGRVYRLVRGERKEICSFVPELLAERIVAHDVDHPGADRTHEIDVRFTTPSGDESVSTISLPKGKSASTAILDAVPSAVARLGVVSATELPRVLAAFASPVLTTTSIVGQTGWVPGHGFALPGSGIVTLDRIASAAGVRLFNIPAVPSHSRVEAGLGTLSCIASCAPTGVEIPLIASIFAGPIHRRSDHLGARGFTVLLAGRSQEGKTTLTSRAYSLHGDFSLNPMCLTTWRSTLPTIEALLHHLRDLTVFIDNFRASDGDAARVFAQSVLAIGDGAARDRSTWTKDGVRIPPGLRPNALLLATGEHGFDDDAAVNGRLVELSAEDIDIRALLSISDEELKALPDVFSAYLAYVAAMPPAYWETQRAAMRALSSNLSHIANARTSEHLSTLFVAFDVFVSFVVACVPSAGDTWRITQRAFAAELPEIARAQASRVLDEHVDQIVLNEIARAMRQGKARLVPLAPTAGAIAPGGELLGAFDADSVHLIPDVTTKWVNGQLRGRRKRIGRKELGSALRAARAGAELPQMTFAGRRQRVWSVPRASLGAEWVGLLDELPPRR